MNILTYNKKDIYIFKGKKKNRFTEHSLCLHRSVLENMSNHEMTLLPHGFLYFTCLFSLVLLYIWDIIRATQITFYRLPNLVESISEMQYSTDFLITEQFPLRYKGLFKIRLCSLLSAMIFCSTLVQYKQIHPQHSPPNSFPLTNQETKSIHLKLKQAKPKH